jgi:hypothetical protein
LWLLYCTACRQVWVDKWPWDVGLQWRLRRGVRVPSRVNGGQSPRRLVCVRPVRRRWSDDVL